MISGHPIASILCYAIAATMSSNSISSCCSSTHWNILSSWSKAGVGTSIVLELKKPPPSSSSQKSKKKASPRIAIDIGATPFFEDAIAAKYIFVSHGHIDHVGALFSHARAHSVTCGGEAPTYFIPAPLMPQLEKCRDAMSLLDASNLHPDCEDGGRKDSLIKMKLVPVHAGDEVPLKGISYGSKTSFFMRAFEVDHGGHPALGYIIGSRTTAGLKKEYQNLDGAKLRDLVKSGVTIKADPVENIEIAYTGDTCAKGLIKQSTLDHGCKFNIGQLFQAELLLCELTFLDSTEDEQQRRKASERGHLHITDIQRIFSSHDPLWDQRVSRETEVSSGDTYPKSIVFYHLSAKYQPAARALDCIAQGLPIQLLDRCHVAISSMLSHEEKSNDNSFLDLVQPNGCISLAEYMSSKDTHQNNDNDL